MVRANFSYKEMACKCGCDTMECRVGMLDALQSARETAKIPFPVNSGYRCHAYDAKIRLAKGQTGNGEHPEGWAVDIKATDSRSRYLIIRAAIAAGFNRIGIAKNFVHLGMSQARDQDVVWLYS